MSDEIMAIGQWKDNASLIEDCHTLGYLTQEDLTLDPTYGYGGFWTRWRPDNLIACDLTASKSPIGYSIDFTALPWPDGHFGQVVYDPPYKLSGTPALAGFDDKYGISTYTRWQDRIELILIGFEECARVLKPKGILAAKCQDQVVSGNVVWETDLLTAKATELGLTKIDRFDFISYRPQPKGRSQRHARRNASQLLIFRKAR